MTRLRFTPEYTRNLDVAASASLIGPMHKAIAISSWAYGIGVFLLELSPSGPSDRGDHVAMIVVAAISLVLGGLWWFGGWPRAWLSLAFLIYSDVVHTGILLVTGSPMLALIATLWFALIGEHMTIAHGRLAVSLHCLWALINIAFFATRALEPGNADHTLILYVAIGLIALVVAIPIFRQLSTDALRDDSRRAAELAERDALTSVLNPRGLHAAVPALLAAGPASDRHLALVVLDLDRFKAINDSFGHHRGDQVLTTVAGRLSASVRRGAVVARTGGEEFVVIDVVGPEGASPLAHRLLAALHHPDDEIPVTASVGVASVALGQIAAENVTQSIQELMRTADVAMYESKRSGGNSVRIAGAGAPPTAQ